MHPDSNMLLQTIRIPKNLLFLTDRLPQANYEKSIPKKKETAQANQISSGNKNRKVVLESIIKESKDINHQNSPPGKTERNEDKIAAQEERKKKLEANTNSNTDNYQSVISSVKKEPSLKEKQEKERLKKVKENEDRSSVAINSNIQEVLPPITKGGINSVSINNYNYANGNVEIINNK